MSKNNSYIGVSQKFVNAKEKVTGKAQYLDDMQFPNLLHGKILRSPHAHARIISIDTSKAEALLGVKAVITAKDCPDNKFGLEIPDVTMLAIDKVRYVGDEVAAVAAETIEIAEQAIKLIDVEYELLPVVDDVIKAMEKDSPLVHEENGSNIAKEYHLTRGDVEADFATCDYVFEDEFSTHRVSGLYLEPFGATAKWDNYGRVTIWTGLQAMFQGRNEIAKALGIDESRVNLKSPMVGGGFGAKIWIRNFHPIVAVLAEITNRPVKIVLTREEEMLTTRPRVAPKIKIKLGMMKDGTLVCKQSEMIGDNGAYSWAATKILLNMAMRTDCLYRFKSSKTDAYLVYTNLIPTSGFRGYGNSQAHFALESFVDICARKIGLEPEAVRLKNAIRQGDKTLHGWNIRSCGLSECIEAAYRLIEKDRLPKEEDNGRIKRGIGVAGMTHVSGNRGGTNFDGSAAMIRIHEDGKVFVFSGETDLGQGSNTVFAQIAAETLGVPIEDITIMPIETDTSPFALGTYSSRVTTVGGKAVLLAAKEVKGQVVKLAAEHLGKSEDDIKIENGKISSILEPSKSLTLRELSKLAIRSNKAVPFTAYITYDPPTEGTDKDFYGDYSSAYTYGAHGVEVEVDTETGKVKVLRIVAAHDVGNSINPNGITGQINGGIAQGIGWTLYEDMIFKDGIPQVRGLKDYMLMTTKDMPKIEEVIIETNDPIGPYGAKGIGEPTVIPPAPAIANAIEDATGVRIKDLPITPEKMYWAIQEKKGEV